MKSQTQAVNETAKLLIHDLAPSGAAALFADRTAQESWRIISDDKPIRPCIGCFGCWLKTPGACVLTDEYSNMGACLAASREVMLVSRCCYGGPSPFIKNVLDRSISYILPYFVIKNGEMHHRQRYLRSFDLTVLFYGEGVSAAEKQTAEAWVTAAANNLYCDVKQVLFRETAVQWEGAL